MARVRADGRFSVGRRMHGQWLSPVYLQARAEVHKGVGQVNALRVVTSGKSAAVYVNDALVVTMRGFPPAGPSKIGVYGESGDDPVIWAFSELSVPKGPRRRRPSARRTTRCCWPTTSPRSIRPGAKPTRWKASVAAS
jgi:hypothetical protein